MRTMNFCIAVGLGLCVMSGCGQMVGKMEYIDNSMSTRFGAMTETAPPRSPSYHRTIPVDGLRLPDLYFDEHYYDHDDTRLPESRRHSALISSAYMQLHALRMDLIRISGLADQNGAAGRAAYDPHLRSFATSAKLIERVLVELRTAPQDEWQGLMYKLEVHLQDAHHAVREAEENVRTIKDHGHVLSMNID